jgi:hypothetical protein
MKLQELINENELELTIEHIKAFLLGVLSADRPLAFKTAVSEMLIDNPEVIPHIEDDLKKMWEELQKNKPFELQNLIADSANANEYLQLAQEKLDLFLTALTLSGTNSENCKNEDLAENIETLEDLVMDIEDYLADENAEATTGKDLAQSLKKTWQDFLRTSKQ